MYLTSHRHAVWACGSAALMALLSSALPSRLQWVQCAASPRMRCFLPAPTWPQTATAAHICLLNARPPINPSRLLRKVEGRSLLVPDEAAPTDRSGSERWPPGWHPGRRVQSQRDVFELLGLPYRHPQERDA